MNSDLQRYLNDHLGGSSGALVLIQELSDRQHDPAEAAWFSDLKGKVQDDRAILKQLLETADMSVSGFVQVAGNVSAKAGGLKLMWEGLDPGELGIFEAYEMLTVGIQGKRLLWRMLGRIADKYPEWHNFDFAEMERQAVTQRDGVEIRRIAAGCDVFASRD